MRSSHKIFKSLDVFWLGFLPIFAAIVSFMIHANFLVSTLLMFGLPSLYLSVKYKLHIKKVALFALIFSIPFTFIFDYFISKDQGWFIVSSLLPYRIFDIVTLDIFAWGYLYVFFVIMYYECFLNNKKNDKVILTTRFMYFFLFLVTLLSLHVYLAKYYSLILNINYAYLVLGTLVTIASAYLVVKWIPHLRARFFKPFLYFCFLAIINEYTSLRLSHWTFPGSHFIGLTTFFGFIIPYEEIVFYFALAAPTIFVFYEFFDDDRK